MDPNNNAQVSLENDLLLGEAINGLVQSTLVPNILYAVSNTSLYTINIDNWSYIKNQVAGFVIIDLAFSASNLGELYGLTNKNELILIDVSSGNVELIGSGPISNINGIVGIAFSTNQTLLDLYGITSSGEVVVIDKSLSVANTPSAASKGIRLNYPVKGLSANNELLFTLAPRSGQLISMDIQAKISNVVGSYQLARLPQIAFDAKNNIMYATGIPVDKLFTIDVNTGVISEIGTIGFNSIAALAFDSTAGNLYGFSNITKELIQINTNISTEVLGSAIKSLGTNKISGMAFNDIGELYTINSSTREFSVVDVNTQDPGQIPLSKVNFAKPNGLSFDTRHAKFTSYDMRNIHYFIDGNTIENIGSINPGSKYTFDYNRNSNSIYYYKLIDNEKNLADSIMISDLGSTGRHDLQALQFNSDDNFLYAIDSFDRLIRINSDNAISTVVGNIGFGQINALIYDNINQSNGIMYGISSSANEILTIDLATGVGTPISLGTTFATIMDLVIDKNTGEIFALIGNNAIVFFDIATGQLSSILNVVNYNGTALGARLAGISIDDSGNLFGILDESLNNPLGELISIDRNDFSSSKIGTVGYPGFKVGLTYSGNKLFTYDQVSSYSLLSLNTLTGAGSTVGAISPNIEHLAHDKLNNRIIGLEDSTRYGTNILLVDPLQGTSTYIGSITTTDKLQGFAINPVNGEFASVSSTSNDLLIFSNTGIVTQRSGISNKYVKGLSFNVSNHILYGLESGGLSKLFKFEELIMGTTNYVSDKFICNFSLNSMAYSSSNSIFYSARNNSTIDLLDPFTGETYDSVVLSGFHNVRALTIE